MLDPRLNHVVAIGRLGSFTLAAQSIGVTQSAVTRSVADLERQLGYTLFHRTARGALLTEEGREFFDRAARLLHDAHELLENRSGRADPFAGVLRIGVCPASLEWQLIRPIGQFLDRHPHISFEVTGASFERMVQQLRSGTVDVVLGFDDAFREWSDIRRSVTGQLRTCLFVRHGHPILSSDNVTIEELSAYNFVSPSDSRPYGSIIQQIAESKRSASLNVIDYFPIVQEIVSVSDAIGVVALDYSSSSNFKRRFATLASDLFPPAPMCCATRTRWEPSMAVRAFINTVRDALSASLSESIAQQI